MKTALVLAISLIALAAPQVSAQQLPTLVAKVYPGAVIQKTKVGKAVRCGLGEGHHDAFCFLTKDPIEKVRDFYAREGVKLEPIPVGKDQNAADDGLFDLEEAVRLQLSRGGIASLHAAPVEFWESHSAGDEVSYFHSVIVMSGKGKGKLQGSAATNKAAILENEIFRGFALTPELAFMSESVELLVDPDRLVPLYNRHTALQGAFFKEEASESSMQQLLGKAREKRGVESIMGDKPELLKTQDNKAKTIDALLGEIEKEAYPTRILIQRSRKDGVSRDPATVEKEWRGAFRHLKRK